jgi:hypothetical protein
MAVLQKKEKALSSEQPFSRKSGRELFFFLPNPHTSSGNDLSFGNNALPAHSDDIATINVRMYNFP